MNSLLQEAIVSTKHVTHAAIIRRKDGVIKAKSPQFMLEPDDWTRIVSAFENPRAVRTMEAGITLMEGSYRAIRADKMSVYAKNEKTGVIIAQTQAHYIIAAYDATMFASVAAEAVEKLGR
ncbi:profilin [Blyttiomyces helicus]|uniref:Profilin n=1 Tax=Blyttiomyces helicus TaxID=388810 RepID=A0A4V1IQK7_9FUNG|nr:profilin [Blyttiomyces helicus]|eukprot:RKO86897.1 profilin [Blyttiomyces helicus]